MNRDTKARELAEQLQDCIDLVTVDADTGMQRYIMDARGVGLLAAALTAIQRETRAATLREAMDAPVLTGHSHGTPELSLYLSGVAAKERAIRALLDRVEHKAMPT